MTRKERTLREDGHHRMRNFSDKIYRENENTILCSITSFFENRAVYVITW